MAFAVASPMLGITCEYVSKVETWLTLSNREGVWDML
jgi:hypothetical protein